MFTKPTMVIMMYLSQIIVLYTLNLQGAVCYLHLNKIGSKKKVFFHIYFTFSDLIMVLPFREARLYVYVIHSMYLHILHI